MIKNEVDLFLDLFKRVCSIIPKECLLLSGGLDSSILMYLIQPKESITISLNYNSSDLIYSNIVAKKFGSNHHVIYPILEEILGGTRELIYTSKTFDPIFIRNNVIQLIGFKYAAKLGCHSTIIGDGADELFAGYNYLHKYLNDPQTIQRKSKELVENMHFFSQKIARSYEIEAYSPFLAKEIIDFSQTLSIKDKIAIHEGTIYGKFFLRKSFLHALGEELVWRRKEALEVGSGMSEYVSIFEKLIADRDYRKGLKKASLEGVTIRNKEHLLYYKYYRQFFDPPSTFLNESSNHKKCPFCKVEWDWQGHYCKMCGAFPV